MSGTSKVCVCWYVCLHLRVRVRAQSQEYTYNGNRYYNTHVTCTFFLRLSCYSDVLTSTSVQDEQSSQSYLLATHVSGMGLLVEIPI